MAMHQVCAENFQICAFLSSHYKYTSKMVAWFYAQLNDAAIPHIQFYTAAYDRYDEDANSVTVSMDRYNTGSGQRGPQTGRTSSWNPFPFDQFPLQFGHTSGICLHAEVVVLWGKIVNVVTL